MDELRGDRRRRLADARLMLLFTPELCPPDRDPLQLLEEVLAHADVIQVRVKSAAGPSPARELHDWTARVLEVRHAVDPEVLVLVNDRVDVALALQERGVDGVHLGTDDTPTGKARTVLGEAPLIGSSTHDASQVAAAQDRPIDYVGFGPVFPTATKGYDTGLGPEAAWVASHASALPLFPIGGIALDNVSQLAEVGRAAVSSAILRAPEPAAVARGLREALGGSGVRGSASHRRS